MQAAKYMQQGKGENMHIRFVAIEDASDLLAIYAPYVLETAITFEYEVPSLVEFQGRIQAITEKYPYLVAVEGEEIVGYAYASAFKGRAAYDWSVEMTVYVNQNCLGKGVGRELYCTLEEMLKQQNMQNANACIAYPNPGSIAFHERMGYKTVAHFSKCGYKFRRWYDMIWMEKFLGDHPKEPEGVLWIGEVSE